MDHRLLQRRQRAGQSGRHPFHDRARRCGARSGPASCAISFTRGAAGHRSPAAARRRHRGFQSFQLHAQRAEPAIDTHALTSLLRNHGAEYWRVLDAANGERAALVRGTTTLCAELWHAEGREMAVHLEDVVMRRTDLAAGSAPWARGARSVRRVDGRAPRVVGATHCR